MFSNSQYAVQRDVEKGIKEDFTDITLTAPPTTWTCADEYLHLKESKGVTDQYEFYQCTQCGQGQYLKMAKTGNTGECIPCDVDYFQNSSTHVSTECKKCEDGFTTGGQTGRNACYSKTHRWHLK